MLLVYLIGRDGFIPTFDPAGEIYGDGPQFGCLQPSPKLQFRFLILVTNTQKRFFDNL